MVFSRLCEYAIRAITSLALVPSGTARAEEIARAESIPLPVLSKVLQDLVRKGLLVSRRGPGGGFSLSRRPELITVRDVVAAIDGLDHFYTCVSGLPACSDDVPCPLHVMWKEMRTRLMESLEASTLRDMARSIVQKERSISRKKQRAPAKPKARK